MTGSQRACQGKGFISVLPLLFAFLPLISWWLVQWRVSFFPLLYPWITFSRAHNQLALRISVLQTEGAGNCNRFSQGEISSSLTALLSGCWPPDLPTVSISRPHSIPNFWFLYSESPSALEFFGRWLSLLSTGAPIPFSTASKNICPHFPSPSPSTEHIIIALASVFFLTCILGQEQPVCGCEGCRGRKPRWGEVSGWGRGGFLKEASLAPHLSPLQGFPDHWFFFHVDTSRVLCFWSSLYSSCL